jgi:hypothetical protein
LGWVERDPGCQENERQTRYPWDICSLLWQISGVSLYIIRENNCVRSSLEAGSGSCGLIVSASIAMTRGKFIIELLFMLYVRNSDNSREEKSINNPVHDDSFIHLWLYLHVAYVSLI